MLRSYEGILKDERILWTGEAPDQTHPIRIRVTVIEESVADTAERGRKMAEVLEGLAESGGFSTIIESPEQWQQEVRKDRSLPGRR